MKLRHSVIPLLLALSACAVGPDYTPVSADSALVDKQWHGVLPHGGKVADLAAWWSQFDDPVLTQIIERAEKDSPTLDAALARVKQARASLSKSDAELFPTVTGTASTTRSRMGSATSAGGETTVASGITGASAFQTTKVYGLDASWEIDLFGGARRAIEESEAQLQSKEASWHDARVTLAGDVADAYVGYRACESTLELYEQQLSSQSDTLTLTKFKIQSGLSAAADGDLSEASALDVSSTLENQKGVCAQDFNLIEQLTSIPADDLTPLLVAGPHVVPTPREAEIASLPAATLEQRPDVAEAERNLAAASAAIGVADAARLPSLSLTGSISRSATTGTPTLWLWSWGPSLSLPVFDAGALAAEAERTRAVLEETFATYRATVHTAVKEVEDAMARLDAVNHRLKQAETSVARYHDYLKAVEANYKAGTTSLLDLEETRRTVYTAEETLVGVLQERAEAWIAMYKAVGGGWNNSFNTTQEDDHV